MIVFFMTPSYAQGVLQSDPTYAYASALAAKELCPWLYIKQENLQQLQVSLKLGNGKLDKEYIESIRNDFEYLVATRTSNERDKRQLCDDVQNLISYVKLNSITIE